MKIFSNKKGMEITMGTIVIAIICLIVLAVVIAIFTGSIQNIADKFNNQANQAGDKGDDAIAGLNIFDCEEGSQRCMGDNLQKCDDGKWITEKECGDGCNSATYTCE